MKIQIGLFYQFISSYKFKPVFRCKHIDNKNFKVVLHPRPVFWLFMHFSQKLQHIGSK